MKKKLLFYNHKQIDGSNCYKDKFISDETLLYYCKLCEPNYILDDVECIIKELAEHPMQKPYLNDARTKMASRDLSFRDAYHGNIAEYLQAVTPEEFERFIGTESINIDRHS